MKKYDKNKKKCSKQRIANEMQEENYSKQTELNTTNQKLLTWQRKYENNLKEVLKIEDVKGWKINRTEKGKRRNRYQYKKD